MADKLPIRAIVGIGLAATLTGACGGSAAVTEPTNAPTNAPMMISSSTAPDPSPAPTPSPATSPIPLASNPPVTSVVVSSTEVNAGGAYPSAITGEVIDNPAFDALEADVVQRVKSVGLPGASLLVVHRGQLVQQEAWLAYDLDTRVPIASGSKWFTAATIMTLVDEGLIGLDEPISIYVPELKGRKTGEITMRQLLSLTSGLIADDKVPAVDDPAVTLQESARTILSKGVVHPPGAAFRYGSQHMEVAGAVAERVTSLTFEQLFQARIAQPLGMTGTRFLHIGDSKRLDVTHPKPAGSAVSTLGDYGRFLEMIVHDGVAPNGEVILSPESIAEMQTNHTETVKYAAASSFRKATQGPYGLGEWLDWTFPDGRAMVLSSDGKFGFRPWIDKRNELFGVYLIVDMGAGYVDGDPDAAAQDGGKVHTSGLWVFERSAEAVGGSLPIEGYPHRD